MKLCTVRRDGGTRAARRDGDDLVLLAAPDVGALLATADWAGAAAADGTRIPAVGAELAAVVPAPGKILCMGLNYLLHIREGGREVPTYPTLFAKYADALLGPDDDVVLPPESDAVDWEAELVVVIGRQVRRATPEEAADAIAGFTVGNDVSMRDWQRRTPEWLQGKSWEASTPIGPVLVTPDEVGGVRPDLVIRCAVDDQVFQDSHTGDLLFDPVAIVAYVSQFTTLRPGDLIFTGTPDGVGAAQKPVRYLKPGETLITTIEGIGTLTNQAVGT